MLTGTFRKVLTIALSAVLTALFSISASAQVEQCPYIENPAHRDPISPQVKERMIELCIEDNKRDFERLVKRTEQLAQLTDEIRTSFEENKQLSKADREKLSEAKALLDKIRGELRADDDDDEEENPRPESVVDAIEKLSESSARLLDEIKKTTRHTISAVAIQSSNTVLKLVKWLQFSN